MFAFAPKPKALEETSSILNIAVIGAGTAGLTAAKLALQQNFNVTVFEQTEEIGGIWYYTDKIGNDQYGIPVHTAMYEGLRTNLPHQLMQFDDHSFPEGTESYPPSEVVFNFLKSYAEHFGLKEHVKLNHLVIRCQPIENDRWELIVKDLPNHRFDTYIFDAVFVCNGHHVTPRIPKIPGQDLFRGRVLHSHDYRTPQPFKDETVLVIGSGPSAMDVVSAISTSAKRVTSSQNKKPNETPEELARRKAMAPSNVTLQTNVKRITETGAEFLDGTHETFSIIVYGTGYNFTYPMLSVDSGITVDDNFIQPLYKQIINIEHPTMAFIGIPFYVPTSRAYEQQANFALKFMSGAKKLPPKEVMLNDMRANTQIHWNKGYRKHYTHYLGPEQKEYYRQLAETAGIAAVADVYAAMHLDSRQTMARDPLNYRKYRYHVVDDKSFTKERYID